MTRLTSVTASLALALAPVTAGAQPAPQGVYVRIPDGSAPEIVAMVAELGQPQTVTLANGESPRTRIEARCGGLDLAYLEAFVAQNPGTTLASLDQPSTGQPFVFPFCLPAPLQPYTVQAGDSIGKIYARRAVPLDANALQAKLTSGAPLNAPLLDGIKSAGGQLTPGAFSVANRGFAATENARRFFAANPGLDPATMRPGDTIYVQTGLRTGFVPLKKGIAPGQAEAEIRRAAGRDSKVRTTTIQQAHPASLIDKVELLAGSCDAVAGRAWPFSVPDLLTALAANKVRRGARDLEGVTVLVVDTGYDARMNGRPIPDGMLGYVRGYGMPVSKVRIGINASDMNNEPEAPEDLPSSLHGSEVAATLLGGSFLEAERANLPLPKVVFASLAAYSQANRFFLDPNAIGRAYQAADASDNIRIINASVAADPPYDDFKTYLKDDSVLLVTAAGNVTGPPQPFPNNALTWPGALGGNPQQASPGLVVSVGAHNPKGEYLYFTRLGRQQVDLLAPGCLIPTFTYENDAVVPRDRSGTSFAAPLVSFVSALLAAEGLPNWAIKNRLITSVDIDGGLASYVWSSGRLNVPRAVRVYEDYVLAERYTDAAGVEIAGPAELWGRLVAPQEQLTLCGELIDKGEIRMLSRLKRGAAPEMWMGWQSLSTAPNAITNLQGCPTTEAVSGHLKLELTGGGMATVRAEHVRQFVARGLN